MTLALQLPLFFGSPYLPWLFETLDFQIDKDWHLYILENGSDPSEKERTIHFLETYQKKSTFSYSFFSSETNLGFSGGNQYLFTLHKAEAVFLLNQDVLLTPNFIAEIRLYLETHSDIGAITGKILRWDWGGDQKPVRSRIIDSLGLMLGSSGKVWDIFSGKMDISCEDKKSYEVFGISGCLPLYRREAIISSSPDGQLFDPIYFSYKEDVDLAYRLHRGGWKSIILPNVIAYHQRSFQQTKFHFQVSFQREFLSYRNHWWNFFLHWTLQDFLKNSWAILPFEIAKIGYLFFKHPRILWRTFKQTRKQWNYLMDRRLKLKQVSK
jgi:GT2 family glycosyltransferase